MFLRIRWWYSNVFQYGITWRTLIVLWNISYAYEENRRVYAPLKSGTADKPFYGSLFLANRDRLFSLLPYWKNVPRPPITRWSRYKFKVISLGQPARFIAILQGYPLFSQKSRISMRVADKLRFTIHRIRGRWLKTGWQWSRKRFLAIESNFNRVKDDQKSRARKTVSIGSSQSSSFQSKSEE